MNLKYKFSLVCICGSMYVYSQINTNNNLKLDMYSSKSIKLEREDTINSRSSKIPIDTLNIHYQTELQNKSKKEIKSDDDASRLQINFNKNEKSSLIEERRRILTPQ